MLPFPSTIWIPPPLQNFPQQPKTGIPEVDSFILDRSEAVALIKENLVNAQQRMKKYADTKRSERSFQVGDMVYLKLQPYRQVSLSMRRNLKLAPKYYGPYKILERIGLVAYRLDLPTSTSIHPVFHASQLKIQVGQNVIPQSTLPTWSASHQFTPTSPVIVGSRRVLRSHNQQHQALIQWVEDQSAQPFWVPTVSLLLAYPQFRNNILDLSPCGHGAP
ncbi:hypothetical protein ACHQM5_014900 [Ranunculus cassubicifolius]